VLPTTKTDNDTLSGLQQLTNDFSSQKGDDKVNVLVDLIVNGLTLEGYASPEEAVETVAVGMKGETYLDIKQDAWEDLQWYYEDLQAAA